MLDLSTPHQSVLLSKERQLVDWLQARGSVLVAFSGGVDSTYLASVALESLGPKRVLAAVGRSASLPAAQYEAARDIAEELGLPLREIATDELSDPRYIANPRNRCYFCKTELWSKLVPLATASGLAAVVDGTNADDAHDHRPGMVAAREHGVVSPLLELRFTKADIRVRSRARGLSTWEQPSAPCLASRIPYGISVNQDRLSRVENAEAGLRAIGVVGDLRVRYHEDLARVELSHSELLRWLRPAEQQRLERAVRAAGFSRVAVDLAGFRSGSLNALPYPT